MHFRVTFDRCTCGANLNICFLTICRRFSILVHRFVKISPRNSEKIRTQKKWNQRANRSSTCSNRTMTLRLPTNVSTRKHSDVRNSAQAPEKAHLIIRARSVASIWIIYRLKFTSSVLSDTGWYHLSIMHANGDSGTEPRTRITRITL